MHHWQPGPGAANVSIPYEIAAVHCSCQAGQYVELRSRRRMRYSEFHNTMINDDTVTTYIRELLPDATVVVFDKTGTRDHLMVKVTSDLFKNKTLLDRHRTIYQALAAPMRDGRIHALEITANTPDELAG